MTTAAWAAEMILAVGEETSTKADFRDHLGPLRIGPFSFVEEEQGEGGLQGKNCDRHLRGFFTV
jgi:hypothetical protein